MRDKRLHQLGWQDPAEIIEFVLCGICTLPLLLLLGGFAVEAAVTLLLLILALALLGTLIEPAGGDQPGAPPDQHQHDRENPRRRQ
ncbi:hypothetical protein VX159_08395 [Dechloromonas sp. ZY10]|uniref:hypothetical protein n=1 Tax=Dechloromonas aquae TaxID=2664436 RepID=UPI003527A956